MLEGFGEAGSRAVYSCAMALGSAALWARFAAGGKVTIWTSDPPAGGSADLGKAASTSAGLASPAPAVANM